MSEIDERKQTALDAIDALAGDTELSRLEQIEALREIAGHCETWADAMQSDQDREQRESDEEIES